MPRYDDYDRYDDDDYDDIRVGRRRRRDRDDREGPMPASGMGISSVCMAGVVLLGYLFTISMIVVVEARNNNNNAPMRDDDPVLTVLGLGAVGSGCLNLAGVILGFVGIFQSDRNPLWAILGAIFNTTLLIGIIGLVCLGLLTNG